MAVFGTRLLLALLVVLLTYNPLGHSYYHWVIDGVNANGLASLVDPLKAIGGVLLLIGWVVLARASYRSLGLLGIFLAGAAIAAPMWLLFDQNWLDPSNREVWTWVLLLGSALMLAIGTSWSMVRRRLTGQIDTDDISTE